MNTLKDFVNWKLAHADKVAEAEGYPLTMENCKKNKKMKQLEIYGNSFQNGTPTPENPIEVQSVGELVTDVNDINYGKYKIPVVTHGKNLYSPYDIYTKNNYEKVIEDGRECIKFFTGLGSYFYGRGFKENTQYTVSFYCKTVQADGAATGPNYDVPFAFTHTDGSRAQAGVNKNSGWTKVTITSTANKTVNYIGCYSFEYRLWNYIDVNTFQIEEGTTATPYEPYQAVTTNIYLDEPLRKLGDYADYVDFKNNKVVRNVTIQYLDDKVDTPVSQWQRSGHSGLLYGDWLKIKGIQDAKAYCNRLVQGNWIWSGNTFPGNYFYPGHNGENLYLIINNQYLDGITDDSTFVEQREAFKKFLTENETYIIYPMATPMEKSLDMELPKLTAKTTIIEVDTNLAPSNSYGKYIKKQE